MSLYLRVGNFKESSRWNFFFFSWKKWVYVITTIAQCSSESIRSQGCMGFTQCSKRVFFPHTSSTFFALLLNMSMIRGASNPLFPAFQFAKLFVYWFHDDFCNNLQYHLVARTKWFQAYSRDEYTQLGLCLSYSLRLGKKKKLFELPQDLLVPLNARNACN